MQLNFVLLYVISHVQDTYVNVYEISHNQTIKIHLVHATNMVVVILWNNLGFAQRYLHFSM